MKNGTNTRTIPRLYKFNSTFRIRLLDRLFKVLIAHNLEHASHLAVFEQPRFELLLLVEEARLNWEYTGMDEL